MGFRLLGDSVDGEAVEDVEVAPRLQALMGQTGVREAHEIVDAAAGAAVATADQPVAAHAPGLARSAANLPRALREIGVDQTESESIGALVKFSLNFQLGTNEMSRIRTKICTNLNFAT